MRLNEVFAKKTYRPSFERRIPAFQVHGGPPLAKFFAFLDITAERQDTGATGLEDFSYGPVELQVIDVPGSGGTGFMEPATINFVRTPEGELWMVDDGISDTAIRIDKPIKSIIIYLRKHATSIKPRTPKWPSMYS